MVLNDEWSQKVSLQDSSPSPCPRPSPTPRHLGLVLSEASHPHLATAGQGAGSPTAWYVSAASQGLCSYIAVPEFFPTQPPGKPLENGLNAKRSLCLPLPPHTSLSLTGTCTHTRTRTHTCTRQGSMAGLPQMETQTTQQVQFWLYSEIFNSWSLTPKLFPTRVCAGPLLWSSCQNSSESASGKAGPLPPRTSGVTRAFSVSVRDQELGDSIHDLALDFQCGTA